MPSYLWSGISYDGQKIEGVEYADSSYELKHKLIKQNIFPLKIKYNLAYNLLHADKIKKREITHFIEQLSILINANIPIITAFNIINKEERNPRLKNLIIDCKNLIVEGRSLGATLEQHPQHFSHLTIGLINAGEQSGNLEIMLDALTTYLKRTDAQKKKIIKSLLYPITILLVAILITIILLVLVIPQFNIMFNDLETNIPTYTQTIINFSSGLQKSWEIILAIFISIIIFLKFSYIRSLSFRHFLERLIFKIPLIRDIYTHTIISRLTKVLGLTLSSGISLITAINISAATISSYRYKYALQKTIILISNGKTLEQAISAQKLFPIKMAQLISLGEETGALDIMLKKISAIYEEELNNLTDNLNNLLEPTITLILGAFVGSLVIGIYLPLFQIGAAI